VKHFFRTLPGNITGAFKGRLPFWHLAAIGLTVALVWSGLDWRYFLATRDPSLRAWAWPAVGLGGLLPMAMPAGLIVFGLLRRRRKVELTGWAIGQAALIGLTVSSAYKAFTGRAHPAHTAGVDISHVFRFGLLRGGMFWGWPSSHTTVAFAMVAAVFTLRPRQRWLGAAAFAWALYVGVGVSMTIHWLSDFAAGAIIGTVIGTVVGRSFREL
jgi:hypothetical protein